MRSFRRYGFILNGVVSISVAGVGEVARSANGDVVGEMSLLRGSLPSATVTALETIDVLKVERRKLEAKLDSDPKFASRFYRMVALFLSPRLCRAMEKLGEAGKSGNPA